MNLLHSFRKPNNYQLDYRRIIKKIFNGNFAYIFGRFHICRILYSKYKRNYQLFNKNHHNQTLDRDKKILNTHDLDVQEICSHIYSESYYDQLELNKKLVASILEAATTKKLKAPGKDFDFTYTEYPEKIKPSNKIAMAHVENPITIEEIHKLRYDNYLLKIASQYLGYFPTDCNVRLWWSFADDISETERRNQTQTIDYHYDIYGLNFFYVSFYITDVNVKSGAHVLVKGSHVNKELSMLLRSARVPDEFIHQHYSSQDIITIEGKAGKCFLEDASCFHKTLPPIEQDRLILQLRYS